VLKISIVKAKIATKLIKKVMKYALGSFVTSCLFLINFLLSILNALRPTNCF